MNNPFSSLKRVGAMAFALISLGSAAIAQVSQGVSGTSGVTNLSAPVGGALPSSVLQSQGGVTQLQGPGSAALAPPATNRVGDATSHLLNLQADGQYASRNAYPVTSDVAQRSYQRYLESFTHKIPENSEAQVGSKAGSSR